MNLLDVLGIGITAFIVIGASVAITDLIWTLIKRK